MAAARSGKTASFCIPVLEKVDVTLGRTQALVLVPTRELALQTSSVLKKLGKHIAGLTVIVSTGGTDLKEDIIRLMKPCHVIVATPGRILDLANKGVADLSQCGVFVMDEADKLLSPEFVPLIDRLLGFTPDTRQVLCFSATFPRTVVSFRDRWCPDAHEINLMEELTLKGVTQFYAFVDERQKVHCFTEHDTRILTDRGMQFVDEIEARLLDGEQVRYGCYDTASRSLCYRVGKLIFAPPPQSIVEFADEAEAQRWSDATADTAEKVSLAGGHLSLRVTPGHRMYVRDDSAESMKSGADASAGYSVTQASELLCPPCACPSPLACPHGESSLRMLSCAESGYAAATSQSSAERARVQSTLRLSSGQLGAFVAVLGAWLLGGTLSTNAVQFTFARRHGGCEWFNELLRSAGLEERFVHARCGCDGAESGTSGCRYAISEPSWVDLFQQHATLGRQQRAASVTRLSSSHKSSECDTSPIDGAASHGQDVAGEDEEEPTVAYSDTVFDGDVSDASHCLPFWALFELTVTESRSLVDGLWRGSGCAVRDGVRCVTVHSPLLREQLMQALLHCGYSAFAVRLPAAAADDIWLVSWSTVADGIADACCPAVRRKTGVRERSYSSIRDGRVWCVDVDHSDHLIFAQRAQRDPHSRLLTKQSRTTLSGNCLNTLFAKLDINQVTATAQPSEQQHRLRLDSFIHSPTLRQLCAACRSSLVCPLLSLSLCCCCCVRCSVYNLLQQRHSRGAAGQEGDGAGLVLLPRARHPRVDGSGLPLPR